VIAVDTNVLVYAHRTEMVQHGAALAALQAIWSTGRGWGLPWPCVHEFLSIVTNSRAYRTPTPMPVALQAVGSFLAVGGRVLGESIQHLEILASLLISGLAVGPRVHDARIAAICLGHGVTELWTADRDFSRFPELKTRNPLVAPTR
jgi:uncharacterized protein